MKTPDDQKPWRQIDWNTIEAEVSRFGAELEARRARDTPADRSATSFIVELEDVFLAFAQRVGIEEFGRAIRKADHVEELRRVLGTLLDVLADWEVATDGRA